MTENVIVALKNLNLIYLTEVDWDSMLGGSQLSVGWCHLHTLTHTTFIVCFAAALMAALLSLAETPTCCCCCCCSARSRHFPALWSVSAAKAGPKLGSLQDFNWVPELFWGCWSVREKKNHVWHLWTHHSALLCVRVCVTDIFIWSSKMPLGCNIPKILFSRKRDEWKKYHI